MLKSANVVVTRGGNVSSLGIVRWPKTHRVLQLSRGELVTSDNTLFAILETFKTVFRPDTTRGADKQQQQKNCQSI